MNKHLTANDRAYLKVLKAATDALKRDADYRVKSEQLRIEKDRVDHAMLKANEEYRDLQVLLMAYRKGEDIVLAKLQNGGAR